MAVPAKSALHETRDFLATGEEPGKEGMSQSELDSLGLSRDPDSLQTSPMDENLLKRKKQRAGPEGKLVCLTAEDIASPQRGLTQEDLDAMAVGLWSPAHHNAPKGGLEMFSEKPAPSSPMDAAILAKKRAHAARRLGDRPIPMSSLPKEEEDFADTRIIAEEKGLGLLLLDPASAPPENLEAVPMIPEFFPSSKEGLGISQEELDQMGVAMEDTRDEENQEELQGQAQGKVLNSKTLKNRRERSVSPKGGA